MKVKVRDVKKRKRRRGGRGVLNSKYRELTN
jgi:hypothetical protein